MRKSKERFAYLPATEVEIALRLEKLDESLVELLSPEQWKSLDFSRFSQKTINLLFPSYSIDELREKHTSSSRVFRIVNGYVEEKSETKCRYSEEELQEMSEKLRTVNREHLSYLSSEQRKNLEPRLYQKEKKSPPPRRSPPPQRPPPFFSSDPFMHFFTRGFNGDSFFNDSFFNDSFFNDSFFNDPFFAQFFQGGGSSTRFSGQGPSQNVPVTPNLNNKYKILDLQPNASEDAIKQAYKKLARKYHPDKHPQQAHESTEEHAKRLEENTKKFQEISEAFKTLIESKQKNLEGEAYRANGTFVRWRSFEKATAFSKKQRSCSEANVISKRQT